MPTANNRCGFLDRPPLVAELKTDRGKTIAHRNTPAAKLDAARHHFFSPASLFVVFPTSPLLSTGGAALGCGDSLLRRGVELLVQLVDVLAQPGADVVRQDRIGVADATGNQVARRDCSTACRAGSESVTAKNVMMTQ